MPASIDGVLKAANVEIVLRQVQMFLVVCRAVQLHTVDRIAFATGKRRVISFELS